MNDAEKDWDDRALDAALQELHGSKPPDLSARVLGALHEASPGPLPTVAPAVTPVVTAVRERRAVSALAAVLIGAIALGFFAAAAGWLLARPAPSSSREGAAVLLDVEVERGTLAGTELRLEGACGEFVARTGNRLRSDGACAFRLGAFGTLSSPARMELEVQSMELTTKHGVLAASSLTLAVVAGVVTWHTLSHTETAAAGGLLRVQAEGGGADAASLTAENAGLKQRVSELQLEIEQLRAQILEREAAPIAPKPVAAAEPDAEKPPEPSSSMTFTDPKFADALSKIDWKAMGAVTNEMGPPLAELMNLEEGDTTKLIKLAGKVEELNGKLVAQVPAMLEAGLPGFGENGFFTHPLVSANLLASTLTAGGKPLTPAQQQSIDGLVAAFARENQSIADAPHEFALEHLLAESEMKDRFYREVGGVLAPEQHGMIFVAGGDKYDGGSLFSSAVVEQIYGAPVQSRDPADFARQASRKIAEELDLDDATSAQVRTLLEHHAAAPELWRNPAELTETKLKKMRAGRTRTALKHQLEWMRVLQQQVSLTPAQKKKLASAKWVLVPLPKK